MIFLISGIGLIILLIGVHTVGNIGEERGPIKGSIVAAYLPYFFYSKQDPHYYISSILAAIFFRRRVHWNRSPPKRRHVCKRLAVLGLCSLLYASLWCSFLYFNMEITNEHGEPIKLRESIHNVLKSPLWKEFLDSMYMLYQYTRVNGWGSLWNEVMARLDPMGERNALSVLDLPSSATQDEITQRWRQLSRKYHPDKFRDPIEKANAQEKFMEIQEAYDKISVINANRKRKSSQSTHH